MDLYDGNTSAPDNIFTGHNKTTPITQYNNKKKGRTNTQWSKQGNLKNNECSTHQLTSKIDTKKDNKLEKRKKW